MSADVVVRSVINIVSDKPKRKASIPDAITIPSVINKKQISKRNMLSAKRFRSPPVLPIAFEFFFFELQFYIVCAYLEFVFKGDIFNAFIPHTTSLL